jgi:hypothetical protein
MTADLRVPQACEFLAAARKRKVSELPPSVMLRELAECRRQLGQVLDVVRANVSLSDDQLVLLGQVIADAVTYRDPSGVCPDCDASPAALCDDHAEDLDRTDAYLALARDLGIEVDR